MKKILPFIFLLNFVFIEAQISTENLEKHVYYLASDEMKGRQTGSKEPANITLAGSEIYKP